MKSSSVVRSDPIAARGVVGRFVLRKDFTISLADVCDTTDGRRLSVADCRGANQI